MIRQFDDDQIKLVHFGIQSLTTRGVNKNTCTSLLELSNHKFAELLPKKSLLSKPFGGSLFHVKLFFERSFLEKGFCVDAEAILLGVVPCHI